jgi:hypothetical protein
LQSHELKLQCALDHLQELDVEITRWLKVDGYRTVTTPDPEPPDHVVRVEILRPLDDGPFSLLIGDFLQDARAALDHLAYSLAELNYAGEFTDEVAESSEFPIIGDVDRKGRSGQGQTLFEAAANRKLAGVSPAVKAAIQGFQPYQRGATWRDDPLWHLHALARVDRHRLLHVAAMFSEGLALDTAATVNARILPPRIDVYGGILERSTEVARLRIGPEDPAREMHMKFNAGLEVVFPATATAASQRPVLRVLGGIYKHISQTIFPGLAPGML